MGCRKFHKNLRKQQKREVPSIQHEDLHEGKEHGSDPTEEVYPDRHSNTTSSHGLVPMLFGAQRCLMNLKQQ